MCPELRSKVSTPVPLLDFWYKSPRPVRNERNTIRLPSGDQSEETALYCVQRSETLFLLKS